MTVYDNQESWWNKIISYFKDYPQWLVEASFALIIGFFIGFIAKSFGRALIYALVVIIVAGYFLHYFNLADFHIEKMKELLGITEIPAVDVALASLWQWMKEHIIMCVAAGLGFVFGWRLGS